MGGGGHMEVQRVGRWSGGTLDRAEVRELGQKLGHTMERRHLNNAMNDMDPDGTGVVTFDMFR